MSTLSRVASFVRFGVSPLRTLRDLGARGEVVHGLHDGRAPVTLITNPGRIEEILVRRSSDVRKDPLSRATSMLVGDSLFTSDGEEWRVHRKRMAAAFTPKRTRGYADQMSATSAEVLDAIVPGEHDAFELFTELSLRVAMRCLLGVDHDAACEVMKTTMEAASELFHIKSQGWLRLVPELGLSSVERRFQRERQHAEKLVHSLIAAGNPQDDTLLGALLDSGASPRQIYDDVMTMIVAGHETTSLALMQSARLLAEHPEELARARSAAKHDSGDYLRWVLLESMRLYPPAWIVIREVVRPFDVAGKTLERGTQIWMPPRVVHRDPRRWKSAARFEPSRWANDLERKLPRCAYFPFGAGPRVCIGNHFAMREMEIVLRELLRRFTLRAIPGTTFEPRASITLRPNTPVRLLIES